MKTQHPAVWLIDNQPSHGRAACLEQVRKKTGQRQHSQNESKTAKALAIGIRRIVEAIQAGKKDQQHEDHREPTQRTRREIQRGFIPAKMGNRHAILINEACKN